jgi:hypothetical protein
MSPCILPDLFFLFGATGLGMAGCGDVSLAMFLGWSAGTLLGARL